MNSPVIAYLSLGSNMGDAQAQLGWAIYALAQLPQTELLRISRLYSTKPWGKVDQPDFLNMVVEVRTGLTPHALLTEIKRIETDQGRVPGERWGPRPLDIDILLYGDEQIATEDLQVPHPRIWERAFVLYPLADLRPDLSTPDGTPITGLLARGDIASQGLQLIDPGRKHTDEAP
jgi:2-amino-4-hydroxy-6-hydroxymethyldihydropteridine diphosphokinase